jgi:hypothetical protein
MATMGMVIVVATAMATMDMVIVAAAPGKATVGVVMEEDVGGLTVEVMGMVGAVVVGIPVTEHMSAQVMAITPIPTNALPQGTAGIHAPIMMIMTTDIRARS